MGEFGEKLLEELDYVQEGRNLVDFYENFKNDPVVKIQVLPGIFREEVLVMEWISIEYANRRNLRQLDIGRVHSRRRRLWVETGC